MANSGLIKVVHVAKAKLGLSDDEYRDILSSFNVNSSKELNEAGLKQLIAVFNKMGFEDTSKKRKYNHLKKRGDILDPWATPKQLRMIEAKWMSSPKVKVKTTEALEKFILRIVKVSKIEWLKGKHVEKVIKAIDSL
jgi:hypothetical protein